MHKLFYVSILFFLGAAELATAQVNLVPNGSFENFSACPPGNTLSNDFVSYATGWRCGQGTCDYFHSCSSFGIVGVPNNFWGYQPAFHGNGYVGLLAFACAPSVESEYIQCKLSQPLKPCTEYRVSFYVSLANYSTYAVREIGAYFSEAPVGIGIVTHAPLLQQPQFAHGGGMISDTANWIKIEGTFIANGCEAYMTIGYFKDDVTNDTLFIQPNSTAVCPEFAYYYVDSVAVHEVSETQPGCICKTVAVPNTFTPNGDGQNDYFVVEGLEAGDELRIFNRWGVEITRINAVFPSWDGRSTSGAACVSGVYYYIIERKKGETIKGFVHLLR